MSKYHKGDKFIVEIKEIMNSDNGTLYRSDFKTLTFDDYGLDKLQKCETELSLDECYNKGLEDGRNEAWELAKKLYEMKIEQFQEVFGAFETELEVMNYLAPQEALAKFEAYEKEQNEIKVGDVVKVKNGYEFLVTHISREKTHYFGITTTGDTYTSVHISELTKTGKHIDIQSVLQQIGGGVDA